LRLRDFFATSRGWLFAVSGYDNHPCIKATLRYVPDPDGSRRRGEQCYEKLEHLDSLVFIEKEQPSYFAGVPPGDVIDTFLPAGGLADSARRDSRVARLLDLMSPLPSGVLGITGSRLLGLENDESDIDMVIYGQWWEVARDIVARATAEGVLEPMDEKTWRVIYEKRRPEISFDEFLAHEERKCNRGAIGGTYFDLLFTREWEQVEPDIRLESRLCTSTLEAEVTAADFAFDSPSVLRIEHPDVAAVVSYSHTYAGQALPGELIEARGQVYESSMGTVLVVGTTREAKGEWVRSLTLLEGGPAGSK